LKSFDVAGRYEDLDAVAPEFDLNIPIGVGSILSGIQVE
jgi:hypothetical protein